MNIDDSWSLEIETAGKSAIEWRRYLHRNPELSFKERLTSDYIVARLSEFSSLEITRPTETSVVAILKGGRPGRTLAFRADTDALPVSEESDAPYASRNAGISHACGHDGHTAILLGAASVLSSHASDLSGVIKFVFQHAEEQYPGGASELIRSGVIDGVDTIVGAHLFSSIASGSFGIIYGPAMASPDTFNIEITGKGGHGAMPHLTVDPIMVASELINALQTVVSRNVDPTESVVLSVTRIHAGTADNVIPPSATLGGTVRTFSEPIREIVRARMEKIIEGICSAHGASGSLSYQNGYGPVVNDEETTKFVEDSLVRRFGETAISRVGPVSAGEDFANYQALIPGSFIFIGARDDSRGIVWPNHHPRFDIDERALAAGIRAFVGIAVDYARN